MKVKSEREVVQWCPSLSDPMDCSLPGSSIHGIFHARLLEWGAIAFSKRTLRLPQIALISHANKVMLKILQDMKMKSESEVAQSYPTLRNPIDCSPPGCPVPGILQARTLEWVAISFSNA